MTPAFGVLAADRFPLNHCGHFLLCGLLFERIEASSGRIVVVGSNAYKMGLKRIQFEDLNFDKNYTTWSSYAQGKLAQRMFACELQRRLQTTEKNVQSYVRSADARERIYLEDVEGFLEH